MTAGAMLQSGLACLGAVLIFLVIAQHSTITELKADLAASEATRESQARAVDDLKKIMAETEAVMVERDRELARARDRVDGLLAKLDEVLACDAAARAWFDTPVPDALLRMRREDGDGDKGRAAAAAGQSDH